MTTQYKKQNIRAGCVMVSIFLVIGVFTCKDCNTATDKPIDESIEKPAKQEEPKKPSPVEDKQTKINRQFSPWDGSHRQLKEYVKMGMNDPKSYEHVKTSYTIDDDMIHVMTVFRGKNAFGGIVTTSAFASFSIDGELIGDIKWD